MSPQLGQPTRHPTRHPYAPPSCYCPATDAGLSVGFVLELDNAVPNVFLSEYMHEKIKTHYAEAVKEEHQRRRDEYQHQHGSDPVELPDMTAQNRRGKVCEASCLCQ